MAENHHIDHDNPPQERVIIFDAMAAVNKVDIKKSIIKSFADFSDVFVDWILDESFWYNEVRVIFDRYLKGSLKTQTTIWRTDDYLQFMEYIIRPKLAT